MSENPNSPTITMSGWSDGGGDGTWSWFASSNSEGWIACHECGATIALRPGEKMDFDHPGMCAHRRRVS